MKDENPSTFKPKDSKAQKSQRLKQRLLLQAYDVGKHGRNERMMKSEYCEIFLKKY